MRQPVSARWQCHTCSEIYDEARPARVGIAPGTRFEDLPDDWVCPVRHAEVGFRTAW